MVRNWWKIVCGILLFYVIIAGLVLEVPARFVLNETIRNLYFHVPMWFTMVALFSVSFYGSLRFLRSGDLKYDRIAAESAFVGILFGILGLLTGSLWAKYTWGAFWTNDVKLNGSAITLLVFLAYAVLRGNTQEEQKRARLAAVYNIFAFVMMVVLIFLLPRMYDSLHPGNGGNPAFNQYDLDGNMRLVFYPAVLGFILLGLWIFTLKLRIRKLNDDITTH